MFLNQEADTFCICIFNKYAAKSGREDGSNLTLSRAEVKQLFQQNFKELLDKADEEKSELFGKLDEDKDGQVDLVEYFDYIRPLYDKYPECFKNK